MNCTELDEVPFVHIKEENEASMSIALKAGL